MNPKAKKTQFYLGLLLATAAFALASTGNIPFLARFLTPRAYKITQGLNALESRQTLKPGEPGFDEISGLYMKLLAEYNEPDQLSGISIAEISLLPTPKVKGKSARYVRELSFKLSARNSGKWTFEEVADIRDEIEKRQAFYWSLLLFVLGIGLTVYSHVTDKEKASAEAPKPSKGEESHDK